MKLLPAFTYIFNHENFDDTSNPTRIGSSVDVSNLKNVLGQFGIKPTVCEDYTLKEMEQVFALLAERDFTNDSALVIFVLTHGSYGDSLMAKDKEYYFNNLMRPLLGNKTLRDKPKIFIFSACRGEAELNGKDISGKDFVEIIESENAPIECNQRPFNIIKCHGTFQGYYSRREGKRGTSFIDRFTRYLDRNKTSSITLIMQRVQESMARDNLPIATFSSYGGGDYEFWKYRP